MLDLAQAHKDAGDVDKLIPTAQEQFNKALASAQNIYDNPDATQEQVDNAWKTLMNVIHALGFVSGDKTELINLVAEAKGIVLSDYEDGAEMDAFVAALQAANDLYAKDGATQDEIDGAKLNLLTAMAGLRLRADKSSLNVWLDELKAIDLTQYTNERADIVRAVIARAEALAAQDLGEDDMERIQAMVAEMENAKAQLEKAPAEPEAPENPKESSKPDDSKPEEGNSSTGESSSEGKDATDKTPTTGDRFPIAALSVLAVASAGVWLLLRRKK